MRSNSATGGLSGMAGRADEKGRFRLNPSPGNSFHVSAYAPDGEPYLTLEKRIQWPRAAVKQQVDLSLPRGVLVRGTVTEGGTSGRQWQRPWCNSSRASPTMPISGGTC